MKFNIIVAIFLLEIVLYSTADEWKDLKKKLIALTILNGLRPVRKQYVVPLPLPLPLPFLLSKLQQTVAVNEKKYPYLVPRPVPVFQLIPKFLPINSVEQKKQVSPSDYAAQESQLYPQFQIPNHGWDHSSWPHDSLYASSDNMPFPAIHPFYDSDQQEFAIESLRQRKKSNNNYRFGDDDNYQQCLQKSKKEADTTDEKDKTTSKPLAKQSRKRNYRTNRSMSKLYDNYDHSAQLDTAQSVHYDELGGDWSFDNTFGHPVNGDLLMSSTDSVKSKNSHNTNNDRQSNARIGTKRSVINFDAKDRDSTQNRRTPQANKFKDGLPVSADEIKGILSDLKTLNDEIKVIPSGQVFARDPPLVNTGVKRVQVGEIRIRPKELRSLFTSGGQMVVDKRQ